MTVHTEPSFWGIACCCVAALMVATFVGVAIGIDPMTLAMH
jgi:hypothetical protein